MQVQAARAAQAAWGRRDWRERVAILRRAAELIRERKFELAAVISDGALYYLDVPVKRLGPMDVPVPFSSALRSSFWRWSLRACST